ncbi:Fic family protein [Candidatus Berkiella aquae]|uniref:Fic family protein n=1 Tax=Candidatus Berkiella aquae TaxID=295108 RepID=A0A0Q9YPR0_9GAMM|nr:Fic family protein [Candidatus Berkiella aquae]MCS5711875.1 Fic family protein [Candidatus Berkiella aquae]
MIDENFYQKQGLHALLNQVKTAQNVDEFARKLFEHFPVESFWRFNVDGVKQSKDSWVGFEKREPGYLQGMQDAWIVMLKEIGSPITNEMLLHYHGIATHPVTMENLTPAHKGQWRTKDVYFDLIKTNSTVAGIVTLLNRLEAGDENFVLARDNLTVADEMELEELDLFNSHTFNKLYQEHLDYCVRRYGLEREKSDTPDYVKRRLAEFVFNSCYTFRTQHQSVYEISSDDAVIEEKQLTEPLDILMQQKSEHILRRYHKLITLCHDGEQKLRIIIETIQQLEQLHPFKDGNCRLFVMIMLNKLLIENGFPPCMLHDPNCFDAFTVDELTLEVIKGMQTFQAYTQGLVNDLDSHSLGQSTQLNDYFVGIHQQLKKALEAHFLSSQAEKTLTTLYDMNASQSKQSQDLVEGILKLHMKSGNTIK